MEWKKYAYTFLITAVIFGTAILASNFFNQRRINEIKDIESQISIDISASETQFSLLSELSCKQITGSLLSQELAALGDRLAFTEQNRGSDNPEVINLKKYYSLLQIKDILLSQKIAERCGTTVASAKSGPAIMYFYSNTGNCPDCQKEGYVLTQMRQDYPELRVYSFDYNLNLSALQTLIAVYNIDPTADNSLPALLINDRVYYGFKSIEDIKNILPVLKQIDAERVASSTKPQATSTKVK